MHYKTTYHLHFARAKRLFIFDMGLLASIIILLGLSAYWFLYDPTVTSQVQLQITQSIEGNTKLKSGGEATYTITYKNESEKILTNPTLTIDAPVGFVVLTAEPAEQFEKQTRVFTLPNLSPGSSGTVQISARFFGQPDTELPLHTRLHYSQSNKEATEEKVTAVLTTLRGSILEISLDIPITLLANGEANGYISLRNTANYPLENISLPLVNQDQNGFTLTSEIEGGIWKANTLAPDEEVLIPIVVHTSAQEQHVSLTLVPTINISGQQVPLATASHKVAIVHPNLSIESTWQDDILIPGQNHNLDIIIKNNGDSTLENLSLSLPLPAFVNWNTVLNKNIGTLQKGTLVISSAHHAKFKKLIPGETASLTLSIPITTPILTGQTRELSLTPTVKGTLPNLPDMIVTESRESSSAPVASSLSLSAQALYYTTEGDQLGRGPLPPRVGEETKYWVILGITNTTNGIENISLSSTLPPGIVYTNESSVSHGQNVTYNERTRTISWNHNALPPYTTAGIYIQLGLTPTASQIGTTPTLLSGVNITAKDSFTGTPLSAYHPPIDSSLIGDTIGQAKGTTVR